MRRGILVASVIWIVSLSAALPGAQAPQSAPARTALAAGTINRSVVDKYCVTCHNQRLKTGGLALDQGREVLAVPGNVLNGRNRGAHGLLRDGAKIVEGADDILEELGLPAVRAPQPGSSDDPVLASLTPAEPADLDAIAARCGLAAAPLLSRLFELEARGLVARVGGGLFVRLDGSC